MKTVKNQNITEEQAGLLTYTKVSELIRLDPVTCALYFDHRFLALFNHVLKKPGGPFKECKILDHYYRIEFQHRGSPHVHMMIWLSNAPIYSGDTQAACIKFIDRFITCDNTHVDQSIPVCYQNHKHTKTCSKFSGGATKCRFNIPFPLMRETMIL